MRSILALSVAVFSLPAFAHDSSSHLEGEHAQEEASVAEELFQLLVPSAEAALNFEVKGNYRYIHADGYPYKAPGQFPNSGNPNSISKKNYQLRVPLDPHKGSKATSAQGTPFGIALNGVLFDPGTAEFWQNDRRSGWNYEALGGACELGLDQYNAHVQPDGTYHYHGVPEGLMSARGTDGAPALLGYAADGFPIYGPYGYASSTGSGGLVKLKSSYRMKQGSRSGGPGGRYNGKFTQDWTYAAASGDLDQCNGRFAVTREYPEGTYHYVLTDSFPFIPRCWMGTPDTSFSRLKAGGPRWGSLDEPEGTQEEVQAALLEGQDEAGEVTLVEVRGGDWLPPFLGGGRPGGPQAGRPPAGRSGGPSPCRGK
ncbi:YHYH protein [Roseibium suaedae]|uniref:YHYH protein n=1 Tax=Roseibium suaedae TaxID=735517 RepID=A0A1M7LBX5_9HYPH|nr:YHYH protein [Roseibium suaedae]SHM75065.1 YHYH protein [Roseibium suaedae]